MSSYKNPAIIPPFQSRVALAENLWKPPKSTEFSSFLSAPPHCAKTRGEACTIGLKVYLQRSRWLGLGGF